MTEDRGQREARHPKYVDNALSPPFRSGPDEAEKRNMAVFCNSEQGKWRQTNTGRSSSLQ